MIHIILNDVRIYRYEYAAGRKKTAKRYHSVFKESGESVKDRQNRDEDIEKKAWKHTAAVKHIEWFLCDWKTTNKVIGAVVKFVDRIK